MFCSIVHYNTRLFARALAALPYLLSAITSANRSIVNSAPMPASINGKGEGDTVFAI